MVERGPLYRDVGGQLVRHHLSLDMLKALIRLPIQRMPPMPPETLNAIHTNYVAKRVIQMFFGQAWFERNASFSGKNKFLRSQPKNQAELNDHFIRIKELAEILYNLQDIPGVDNPLDQLYGGNQQISSGLAELEAGRALRMYGVSFRYITPSKKAGHDYDLEIIYPNGATCCGDVKEKQETTTLSRGTLDRAVDDALGRNLPKDRPCVVLIKVPQHWYESPELGDILYRVVGSRTKLYPHLVGILIFATVIETVAPSIARRHVRLVVYEVKEHKFRRDGEDWGPMIADYSGKLLPYQDWMLLEPLCAEIGATFKV